MVAPALIAAGANLIGGWFSGNSAAQAQQQANQINIDEAARNRQFQDAIFNKQAQINQGEAIANRNFNAEQGRISREFNKSEAEIARGYNTREAEVARLFNSEEAVKNRKFQEEQILNQQRYETDMSNSAWQRATADMKKAGINPMLAYMQGGASTPNVGFGSGSQASSGSASSGAASSGNVSGSQGSVGGVSGAQGHVLPADALGQIMARKIQESISTAAEARRIDNIQSDTDVNKQMQKIGIQTEKVNAANARKIHIETKTEEEKRRAAKADADAKEKESLLRQKEAEFSANNIVFYTKKVGDFFGAGINSAGRLLRSFE